MMEKMENIVFDRNYEEDEPDPLAQAIFDRVNAPGGFFLKPPRFRFAIHGSRIRPLAQAARVWYPPHPAHGHGR